MLDIFEYSERDEDRIKELPKEIADEIINEVKLQENDENFKESSLSTERICDYISLDYFPERTSMSRYMSELRDRVIAAPLDEMMSLCRFIASRQKLSDYYNFTATIVAISLLGRDDKEESVKRLNEAGFFELLNLQKLWGEIVQLLQNQEKNQ